MEIFRDVVKPLMAGFGITRRRLMHEKVTIQYPEEQPMKLVLKAKNEGSSKSMEITNIPLVTKRHPVFRVYSMEQNDIRLSFKQDSMSLESLDTTIPVSRTVTKPVINVTEDSENDDSVFTAPR